MSEVKQETFNASNTQAKFHSRRTSNRCELSRTNRTRRFGLFLLYAQSYRVCRSQYAHNGSSSPIQIYKSPYSIRTREYAWAIRCGDAAAFFLSSKKNKKKWTNQMKWKNSDDRNFEIHIRTSYIVQCVPFTFICEQHMSKYICINCLLAYTYIGRELLFLNIWIQRWREMVV